MTREEAIKQLKKCRSFHNGSYGEAFAMAIKALEQESCEDAISRELVREEFCNWVMFEKAPNNFLYVLGNLPSVTPQLKIGRWIKTGDVAINGSGQLVHEVQCSECSGIAYFRKSFDGKYVGAKICPNCGAKMQEVDSNE